MGCSFSSTGVRALAVAAFCALQACSGSKSSLPPANRPAHGAAATGFIDQLKTGRKPRDINNLLSAITVYPIYRFQSGGYDSVSTGTASEAYAFPNDGPIFYLPANPVSGTTELYRLFRSPGGGPGPADHMDSYMSNEAANLGYHEEGGLGFGWTAGSQPPGTSLMQRIYNPSTSDHALVRDGETFAGYQSDLTLNMYAYKRYGNTSYVSGGSITGGGITIDTNAVAGGSIWSWTWNGKQFVNTSDFGREIQSDFVWGSNPENPTEAGDGCYGATPGPGHGSPLISTYISGAVLMTRAVPLEFTPTNWGTDCTQALVYKDTILGKTLVLNYDNLGPVVEYDSYLSLSQALDFTPNSEFPTGYLTPDFNQFYTYDAGNDTLSQVHPSVNGAPNTCSGRLDWQPASGYGGVIISTASSAYAMGVYTPTATIVLIPGTPPTYLSGFTTTLQLWDYTGCGADAGPTSKWSAVVTGHNIPAGPVKFRAWVISGTLTQVRSLMRSLQQGA
jgi:hypothetical protein